jgi:predicted PurR-regulated permease PerM
MAKQRFRNALVVLIILFSILGFGLYLSQNVLLPFLIGAILAYIANPGVCVLERYGCPRWFASILFILAFFITVIILTAVIFPLIKSESLRLATLIPSYLQTARQELTPFFTNQTYDLSTNTHSELFKWLSHLFTNLLSSGWALANLLSLLLVTPIVAFYMLRDWQRLLRNVDKLWPRTLAPVINSLFQEIDETLAGFIRGQASVCIILAVYYTLGLTAINLNFAPTIGIITGVLTFIPYVGAIVGFALALLVATGQYTLLAALGMVAVVFGLGQVIESQILTPRLVGGRVGLHPVWVIFSLFAGGSLLGITGIFLAIPCAAIGGVLVRAILRWYLESAWYKV